MKKAVWNGVVLAESPETVVVEGNHYFPPASVHWNYFEPSKSHSTCPWKGVASYYDIHVGTEVNRDAAWYYENPTVAAANIKDHVAFWKGVEIDT